MWGFIVGLKLLVYKELVCVCEFSSILVIVPALTSLFIILLTFSVYDPNKDFLSFIEPGWKLNWCIDTSIHGQFCILSSFTVHALHFNYLLSMGPFKLHIPLSFGTFLQSVHSY